MKKNKKWIIPVIIILIIVCLVSALIISLELKSKNEISKVNLPQANAEQENNKSDETQLNEETTQNDNNTKENDESQNSVNNSSISTQNDATSVQTVNTSEWDLTKVDIVYDTANVAVPVPKGYIASGADGEHTVNTGFVIYEGTGEVTNENAWNESCTRNQWVWVPVPDISRIYETDSSGKKKSKLYTYNYSGRSVYANNNYEPNVLSTYDNEMYFSRYGLQGMTKKKLLNELQDTFESTIESIQIYGGFWIGRYETGNIAEEKPVVQRMNNVISNQNWYFLYTNLKRIDTNINVETSMIWGCLWDETLQWLIDSGNKTNSEIKNSTSWGNYKNSTFEYTDTNGNILTKLQNTSIKIPSGSTEYTKANNIYDLGGNVYEWTLETNNENARRCRGGDCGNIGSGGSAPYRYGYNPKTTMNGIGTRAYLYIK